MPHACNFIKKETRAQVFSCNFFEISKNTFFTEHLWTTASVGFLVYYLLIFVAVQVMGNTNPYPECENHMRLLEPGRKHENNQPSSIPDGNNLTAGWYRVDLQAGQRLLDITDIPKNFFERNTVRFTLVHFYANNIIILLQMLLTKLAKCDNLTKFYICRPLSFQKPTNSCIS